MDGLVIYLLLFLCLPRTPDGRKMQKSAFKLNQIHLHIFDYSVNLPLVIVFHSIRHRAGLWRLLLRFCCVCVCVWGVEGRGGKGGNGAG